MPLNRPPLIFENKKNEGISRVYSRHLNPACVCMHAYDIGVISLMSVASKWRNILTIWMKELTCESHFRWTKWIVWRKCKPCWKNSSIKHCVFWTPSVLELKKKIVDCKLWNPFYLGLFLLFAAIYCISNKGKKHGLKKIALFTATAIKQIVIKIFYWSYFVIIQLLYLP